MRSFLAGLAAGALAVCAGYSLASRNSSGTMSGVNGPYTAGSTISSSAINARFSDIETEITDSLDRSGKGGMLAALRGIDGTVAAPAYSWTSETGTGWYRIGAGNPGLAVSGSKRLECTTTGCVVTGTLGVTSDVAVNTNKFTVTASTGNVLSAGTFSSANGTVGTPGYGFTNEGTGGGLYLAGAHDVRMASNGSDIQKWTGTATTTLVPLIIGSSGTAISGSFRGTASWSPGSISGGGGSATTAITVTGATAGTECVIGTVVPNVALPVTCWVTANTCTISIVNQTAGAVTPFTGTNTFVCRVFNP